MVLEGERTCGITQKKDKKNGWHKLVKNLTIWKKNG